MDESELKEIEARAASCLSQAHNIERHKIIRHDIPALITALRHAWKERDRFDAMNTINLSNYNEAQRLLYAARSEIIDLRAEDARMSDIITSCGFELYQDGDAVGLKLIDTGDIYMPKTENEYVVTWPGLYAITVPDADHPDGKVYGAYVKVPPGEDVKQALQLVKFPLVIVMPCKCETIIPSIDDFPRQSVQCTCGNPNHWFVFAEEATDEIR